MKTNNDWLKQASKAIEEWNKQHPDAPWASIEEQLDYWKQQEKQEQQQEKSYANQPIS